MSKKSCTRDAWLSSVLRRSVYRLEAGSSVFEHAQDCGQAGGDIEACLRESPVFMYAKIPCRDTLDSQQFSDKGFYCVEASLVFEKPVDPHSPAPQHDCPVRFAVPEDEGRVRALARSSFIFSRFHLDHQFSKDEADGVKEAWAGNFFHSRRGTHMVVAENGPACTGFLQLLAQEDVLLIDLFAVDAVHRGRGIAGSMIAFAERSLPGISRIRVGTQAVNIPSVRLYERCGFRLTGSGYVFHYHN